MIQYRRKTLSVVSVLGLLFALEPVHNDALALDPPHPPAPPPLPGLPPPGGPAAPASHTAAPSLPPPAAKAPGSASKSGSADDDQSADGNDAPDSSGGDKDKKSKIIDLDADAGSEGADSGAKGKQHDDSSAIEGALNTTEGDKRIKMLLYDPFDVYTITMRYTYQTSIVFSPQEEIQLISVGDRSMWQIIPSGNRIFIRPLEEDVITNMTVLTNKHSYQFDLKSLPSGAKTGNIYVAQFVYGKPNKPKLPMEDFAAAAPPLPPEKPAAPAPVPSSSPFGVGPSVPATQTPVALAPSQPMPASPQPSQPPLATQPSGQTAAIEPPVSPNYSYTYAGPDDLAPLQVYDDGHATYLKYNNIANVSPSAFIVDQSGKESPVNYSRKGDYIVINAVVGELALKSSGGVVHVFNETINPG